MNKVILMGRATKDPEIRYSQGEQAMAIARFHLAVERRYKKEGESTADFISCLAFGKTAEIIEKYVFQGKKLVVEGRIQTGSYTNKEGVKVYTTEVVIENLEFAESRSAEEGRNGTSRPVSTNADGFMNIPDNVEDEGLPFNS